MTSKHLIKTQQQYQKEENEWKPEEKTHKRKTPWRDETQTTVFYSPINK